MFIANNFGNKRKMTTVGISGGNGMLGNDVKLQAEDLGYCVNIYDLPKFDLTNQNHIKKLVSENDIIINCAAYTAVDQAESEKEICKAVNCDALYTLGKAAKLANKYILHISTDFVFGDDGDQAMDENFKTNPLSVYGSTKLDGETALTNSGCRCGIIRVQWTYGEHGNHFISKIAELATKLDALKVVDDQFGAPTPTTSVANAVISFIKNETEGLYHFAAAGYSNRFEVAKVIIKTLNLQTTLSPCDSGEFSAPAKRPLNSRFNCDKIDQVIDFIRPNWKDALEEFLQKSKIKK